ncbi:MAG: DUF438 domain-containing protein [Erysipelotrichaceae bacterium]
MSELIDNQYKRQVKLKELIQRLHHGDDPEAVKAEFKEHFQYVTGAEIAAMEANLVDEGTPVEEIQYLCDIHASIFQGSVQEMHDDVLTVNPLKEFEDFNNELRIYIEDEIDHIRTAKPNDLAKVKLHIGERLNRLSEVEAHYSKKENILFPFLEKNGITTPPKVMWGVDNNIRAALRKCRLLIEAEDSTIDSIKGQFIATVDTILEMTDKEEKILFPMLRDVMREEDWKKVAKTLKEETDFDYGEPETEDAGQGIIPMSLGKLSFSEADALLNTLPMDITFVDANNLVAYVSQGKDRIFDRPKTVIGREVKNCHPPQSVHVVESIIEDLRAGKKDHEDFWIHMGPKYVLIRYYAVRKKGEFLGVMEVTMDITSIQAITGEKRLVGE